MADLSNPEAILDVPVDLIDVPAGRRRLDPSWIKTLSDLFASQGQLSPIELITAGGRFRLVFGHHRLAAGRTIGWSTIRAIVKDASAFASEADIALREITENMARRELSALDRSVDIARWREVYEAARGAVQAGRPKKSGQVDPISDEVVERFAGSFAAEARRVLGVDANAIKRAMRITSIPAELRDRIALHTIADNQSELLALASQPAGRQAEVVALLTSEPAQATSVANALALVDRVPAPAPAQRWEKLSDAFSRLKEREQDRFFDLHEGAIRRWLAARGQA